MNPIPDEYDFEEDPIGLFSVNLPSHLQWQIGQAISPAIAAYLKRVNEAHIANEAAMQAVIEQELALFDDYDGGEYEIHLSADDEEAIADAQNQYLANSLDARIAQLNLQEYIKNVDLWGRTERIPGISEDGDSGTASV